jgi:hypothetical protein
MLFNSPIEVERSPINLVGFLTCASSEVNSLPRTLIPVASRPARHILGTYSYVVATDFHRLPYPRPQIIA